MFFRHLHFLVLAILFAVEGAAFAQIRERYSIEDGGRARTFSVATDEIHVADANRRARKQVLAGLGSVEAARTAAERHAVMTGEEAELVLYEEGAERNEFTRRILTKKLAVRLRAGANAAALALKYGLISRGELTSAPGWFIFEATKTGGALEAAEALRADAAVEAAEPQLARKQQKRFVPNDPLFSQQLHLRNTAGGTLGIDVQSVWDSWRGSGVRIGIVDDGLQISHPDLSPNVDAGNHHDWNDGSPDTPNPDVAADFHGTACAGVAAGRGNNGVGISGTAPEATLVGLRLIAAAETDQDDADAMNWKSDIIQVKSNSWGPADDGKTLEAPGTLMNAALANAVQTGRGGLGTIFLWAGGNGGEVGDNSNYDGYANSPFTIAVGVLGLDLKRASYSEPGANVIITTPVAEVTTDLTGANGYNAGSAFDQNYTNDFNGTSSATPLAAGCVAVLLQSKPTLGWRDVQEILIRSASKIDPTNTDWVNNAAGWHFNHNYGAGLINVQAAVNLAATWTNLAPQQNFVSAQTGLSVAIPDNNTTGVMRTFNVASSLRAERVTMKVNINHVSRGQLAVTLTSPSGTVSRLAEKHTDSGDNYVNWTFTTVRSWGENSTGTWTLKITDGTSGTTGTLTAATLTIFGTPTTPVNQPPTITAAPLTTVRYSDETVSVASVTASDLEGDAITFSYQWQESADGLTFTPIAGATASTLVLTAAQSGRQVRCAIVATATGGSSAPFLTSAVAVNRRPVELAQHGQSYSYDSDLFFTGSSTSFVRNAIINEFSQGANANKEWLEVLLLKTSDLRGWSVQDSTDTYSTFANVAAWSSVPAGTLIVIYKGTERDTALPASDDLDPVGGSVLAGHNNAALFEVGNWSGLSNMNSDTIQLRDPAGAVIDAVSFNNNTTYDPHLAAVAGARSARYDGNTEAGVDAVASWTIVASSAATPTAGNGSANTAFVNALRNGTAGAGPQFRFGAAGDVVPGLGIDATTGVINGTPTAPGGGFFQIVIERFAGTNVVTQTFPLLIADAAGNFVIPAGKTWTLDQATTLNGSLTLNGALDTNGRALIVNGRIVTGATVMNASGTISYLQRSGGALPGTTFLIVNALNDLADYDGDGNEEIVEFALGLDPGVPGVAGLPVVDMVAGHLVLTYSVPVGALGVGTTVEVSENLASWQSGAGFTETLSDDVAGGVRTRSIRDITADLARFIRLKVSR